MKGSARQGNVPSPLREKPQLIRPATLRVGCDDASAAMRGRTHRVGIGVIEQECGDENLFVRDEKPEQERFKPEDERQVERGNPPERPGSLRRLADRVRRRAGRLNKRGLDHLGFLDVWQDG
jgi:hypothetical protein